MADCTASAGASASGDYAAAATSELVARANLGDQAAWDQLVDRYGGIVWAVVQAQGLRPDDAADVSQVTWLLLTQHLGCLGQPERLGGWLRRTAAREAYRMRRLRGHEVPVVGERDLGETQHPAHAAGVHLTLGPGSTSPRQRTSAAEVVARS